MMLALWGLNVTEDDARKVLEEWVSRRKIVDVKEGELEKVRRDYESLSESWKDNELFEKQSDKIEAEIEEMEERLSVDSMKNEVELTRKRFGQFAMMVRRSKTEVLASVQNAAGTMCDVVIGKFGLGVRRGGRGRALQLQSWSDDWNLLVQCWPEVVVALQKMRKREIAAAMSDFFVRMKMSDMLVKGVDDAGELRIPMERIEIVDDDEVLMTECIAVYWKSSGEVDIRVICKHMDGKEGDVVLGGYNTKDRGRTVYVWPFVRKLLPVVGGKAQELREKIVQRKQKVQYVVEPLMPYCLAKEM